MTKQKYRIVHVNDDTDIIKRLVTWRMPFTAIITGSTRVIKSERNNTKYICSNARLPFETLGFIRQVKKAAGLAPDRGVIDPAKINPKEISYFRFSDIRPGIYKDVIELDVNSAYWNLALNSGYIDRDTYEKGKEVDKMTRLVGFGSLATVKHVYQFDGTKLISLGDQKNDLTRSYFFDVAWQLDQIMRKVFELYENHILWYWVDAFFINKKAQGFVRSMIQKHGLECKIKHIDEIEVYMQGTTKVIVCRMADGEEKPFFQKSDSGIKKDLAKYQGMIRSVQQQVDQEREHSNDILRNFTND